MTEKNLKMEHTKCIMHDICKLEGLLKCILDSEKCIGNSDMKIEYALEMAIDECNLIRENLIDIL